MSRIFGAIAQNGYVVRDIHQAMDHWINVLGVGPWFFVERVQIDKFTYRGQPSSIEMSVAMANSGDIQIELIQQLNDAPSMYLDFLAAGHEGLQHISYWTNEYQDLYDKALSLGYNVGQEGQIGGEQGRFAYFDSQGHQPGTVIEISDLSGPKRAIFDYIKKASIGWNGAKPIRKL
ncbi:MAG: VOC family protein [Gammaproteobacteria bacterium]|nr:VOC family protein [Gammaproteobacteria bacterium]